MSCEHCYHNFGIVEDKICCICGEEYDPQGVWSKVC